MHDEFDIATMTIEEACERLEELGSEHDPIELAFTKRKGTFFSGMRVESPADLRYSLFAELPARKLRLTYYATPTTIHGSLRRVVGGTLRGMIRDRERPAPRQPDRRRKRTCAGCRGAGWVY